MGYFDLKRNSEGGEAIISHAETHHHPDGSDAIAPADIGARPAGVDIDWGEIADAPDFGAIYRAIADQIPWTDIEKPLAYPPSGHRINHRHDGSDSITPIVFNNGGFMHITFSDFNALPNYGSWFVQGTLNGPNTHGSIAILCFQYRTWE